MTESLEQWARKTAPTLTDKHWEALDANEGAMVDFQSAIDLGNMSGAQRAALLAHRDEVAGDSLNEQRLQRVADAAAEFEDEHGALTTIGRPMTKPEEDEGLVAWATARLKRKTDAELRELLKVLERLETAEASLLGSEEEGIPEQLANTCLHIERVLTEIGARRSV